jgi:UDP-N-acetylmuramoyl-tripeptide--D-alanyl-D-alanine ligase
MTQDFAKLAAKRPGRSVRNNALVYFVYLGALLQALVGLVILVYGLGRDDADIIIPYGLALVVSYPIIWAHMLALKYAAYKLLWGLSHPKAAGRLIVCKILERQVVKLRAKHKFVLIAVAGSVGKTSTKLAIAHALEPTRRVIYQTGNYNDRVTVPLVLFGHKLPALTNIVAWIRIFLANERAISRPNYYDAAVVELGTDHPGQISKFAYLNPDITVVTALTPEHMEFFGTLDEVAKEELAVCDFSKQVLVNADDSPAKFFKKREVLTYGIDNRHLDFAAENYEPDGLKGGHVTLRLKHGHALYAHAAILGEQGVKILLAAAACAQLAGLENDEISQGLAEIKPFAGRMQILQGIKKSTIIDDTYNASPAPVIAALDVLYSAKAKQRIAILGNMNELGDYSEKAHTEVGEYCRPDKLDLVVTIGPDAETYLAPAALKKGCKVKTFDSPYAAGKFVEESLKTGAVILAEGSQNRVFAEESLKVLLADKSDAKKLVRQSAAWLRVKKRQFRDFSA